MLSFSYLQVSRIGDFGSGVDQRLRSQSTVKDWQWSNVVYSGAVKLSFF